MKVELSRAMIFLFLLGFGFNDIVLAATHAIPDEICDNAQDDDGDGLIDLNDPDCDCKVLEPESLIPNHSFEDMKCCPDDQAQLRCADFWIQASEPTTDYIHTCGYMGWDEFPPPQPFPDGQGIIGFRDGVYNDGMVNPMNIGPFPSWKEYVGACLNLPLVADSTYRLQFSIGFVNDQFSPPINITLFGTTNCSNLPYGLGDPYYGCPTNGPEWVELGYTWASGFGQNVWMNAVIELTPTENIYGIALGPECQDNPRDVSVYYFLDDLFLAEDKNFDLLIKEFGHICSDGFFISVPSNPLLSFQWYKNGIALLGETESILTKMYGEGIYQVRALEGFSCRLSGEYLFEKEFVQTRLAKSICESQAFEFGGEVLVDSGQYFDTLKTTNSCDSIVVLDLNILGEFADTIEIRIFQGDIFTIGNTQISDQGDHLVSVPSSVGCDSFIVVNLEFYSVYVPNVFSPNNDGINDVFTLFGNAQDFQSFDIKIYSRWGGEIHQGSSWDGTSQGEFVDPGVFVYMVQIVTSDGVLRQLEGSVTVVR